MKDAAGMSRPFNRTLDRDPARFAGGPYKRRSLPWIRSATDGAEPAMHVARGGSRPVD